MTTQTELKLEQLPYGKDAETVKDLTALIALPGKLFRAIGRLIDTVGEAIQIRNRYVALDNLDDATLQSLGLTRQSIARVVAQEAGLLTAVTAPVAHNSNERTIRPAA